MFLTEKKLYLYLVVGITRAGVSPIILTRGLQLDEMRRYFVPKMGSIAIALLTIIIMPPILQPALATATNLPPANTTIYDDNNNEFNNSVTVLSSNQSGTLLDKTSVTLRGLFTDLANPGRWNQLLQPALDELNRRHPDMNIQIEYDDFPYNITRNSILERLSNGESVDIVSVDQIWLGEFARGV